MANRGIGDPGLVEISNIPGEAIEQQRGLDVIRRGLQGLQLGCSAARLLVGDAGASAAQVDGRVGAIDDGERSLFLE